MAQFGEIIVRYSRLSEGEEVRVFTKKVQGFGGLDVMKTRIFRAFEARYGVVSSSFHVVKGLDRFDSAAEFRDAAIRMDYERPT